MINQFGLQTLTVQDPVLLGVPTQKLPFGPPPVDVNGAPFLDHFKIYNATGAPVDATVDLVDQFHQELGVPVLQPRYFGNPVVKVHNDVTTTINHPNDFLVCYDIVPQAFPLASKRAISLVRRALRICRSSLPTYSACPARSWVS